MAVLKTFFALARLLVITFRQRKKGRLLAVNTIKSLMFLLMVLLVPPSLHANMQMTALTIYGHAKSREKLAVVERFNDETSYFLVGKLNEKLSDGGRFLSLRNNKVVYLGNRSFFPKVARNKDKAIPITVAAALLCKAAGLRLVMAIPKEIDSELYLVTRGAPEMLLKELCNEHNLFIQRIKDTVFISKQKMIIDNWELAKETDFSYYCSEVVGEVIDKAWPTVSIGKGGKADWSGQKNIQITVVGDKLDIRLLRTLVPQMIEGTKTKGLSEEKIQKVLCKVKRATKARKYRAAKILLVKLIKRTKPKALYYNLLFKVMWKAGAKKAACKALKKSLKLEPTNKYARKMIKRIMKSRAA